MVPMLGHFILILQLYFVDQFSLQRALYILTVLAATYPLFRLHMNQRDGYRQPRETAWLRSISALLGGAFSEGHEHPDYPPDEAGLGSCLTQRLENTSYGRVQRLEYDASYLRVSKGGIWMHRRLAWTQEHAILRFHSGWSNFADWLSDTMGTLPRITSRQSQRLYLEHFARRLIVAHGLESSFTVPSNSNAQVLAESVRGVIGRDGGVVAGAMEHGYANCTHLKRYTSTSDLVAEGAVLGSDETGVIGGSETPNMASPFIVFQIIGV
ncbi:hypothetical protein MSAN_01832800 [Mycena sanguinolenta]|uniref:Uncharacterized protein n=1 Tax=Mycena sanguinolenta TaxID=230812 RepID=A0A8H6XRV7_9AGAR|nr:hypothetical protein MSAN_01832800 [Mycena sanguinolenta]